MTTINTVKLSLLGLAATAFLGCGLRPMPPSADSTPRASVSASPGLSTPSITETPQAAQSPEPSGGEVRTLKASSRVKVEQTPVVSSDVESLARSLTKDLRSDKDRARALYRWLGQNISYDVAALSQDPMPDQSAEEVYRRRSGVCAGYANLFQAMATVVGVESEVIPGRSPDRGLELSTRFGPNESNHAWNAVKVDGEWWLLDSTWGAGHLDDSQRFVQDPNDDWFMVDPKVFIYSHLPEDPKWQLLSETVTREEFDHMPELRPEFFDLGFELLDPTTQPVASGGETVFRVATRKGNFVGGAVHRKGKALPDDLVLTQETGEEAQVRVRFPDAGEYQVYIMARKPGSKTYNSVARLEVQANAGVADSFPKTFGTFHEHEVQILNGTQRTLSAGAKQRLSYQVDGVNGLYLQNGSKQIPFEQHGNVYTLDCTPQAGEVTVFAHFPSEQKLWALVGYVAE